MNQDQIFAKVKDVLVDALAVDEDQITPNATLFKDLGAESIDILDISFKLEKAFGFKIAQGEFFPENVTKEQYVKDGRVTAEGLAALKQRLPHVDFSSFEKDPKIDNLGRLFTVQTVVSFVERKLTQK